MPKDLLIPGTGGNKLLLDGADLGWPSLLTAEGWLAGKTGYALGLDGLPVSAQSIVDVLSMQFADATSTHPTKTTLKDGSAIAPGPVLEVAYNQFAGFDEFTYDFRSDVRRSGELLLAHLLDQRPAGDRWRIVCHSQGGLLVAVASKLHARNNGDDDRAFANLCSHVAFVGTPFYGTLSAAATLIDGDELSAGFAASFRAIARTWPSLHQMLPVWPGSVKMAGAGGAVADAPFNALDARAWPGVTIDPAMLSRARDTRTQFLDSPLSRMNGVKLRILMSRAWPTAGHMLVDGGTLSVPGGNEQGDSLVPSAITYAAQARVEKDVTHLFGTNQDTLKHLVLCDDPFVASEVTSFFGQ